jgi:hypothetical protein
VGDDVDGRAEEPDQVAGVLLEVLSCVGAATESAPVDCE